MACSGGGGCQSNCYREELAEAGGRDEAEGLRKGSGSTPSTDDTIPVKKDDIPCYKCKGEMSVVFAQPSNPIDGGALCLACFRSSIFSKFKLAVTSNSMISPTDKVLIAISGGPASRLVLQFVHEMQHKAHLNLVASRERSLPAFGVGVAFIDETAICNVSPNKVEDAIDEIKLIVSSLAPPQKALHITHIEEVFSPDPIQGRIKMRKLLCSIPDVSGKDDLLQHMRMHCLQKIASDNGYNKLVLGSSTSRIACHVISATVKGKGFSLPADIQYVDARREIPVILPLRDCLQWELEMLCSLDGLKTYDLFDRPNSGINGLVSSFVAMLQEENPSRERTIVRTADKLNPFCFNKLPEINSSHDQLLSRRHKKFQQSVNSDKYIEVENFCLICYSPLDESELDLSRRRQESSQPSFDRFADNCCSSCWFQILPKEPKLMEHFHLFLPETMTARAENGSRATQSWLREKIEDCLLSEDEDGT